MSELQESALVVLVPEAETLVKPFRDRYDPSAAVGVPAHITVLYPFKPPREITAAVTSTLQSLFARFPCFSFSLTRLQTFPDVLYLAPTPSDPFKELTRAVTDQFPETPPYGGAFADIIPHLTVVRLVDNEQRGRVAADVESATRSRLPIRATADEVALMDNARGSWQVRTVFCLGNG
jgi:hypothetical protein